MKMSISEKQFSFTKSFFQKRSVYALWTIIYGLRLSYVEWPERYWTSQDYSAPAALIILHQKSSQNQQFKRKKYKTLLYFFESKVIVFPIGNRASFYTKIRHNFKITFLIRNKNGFWKWNGTFNALYKKGFLEKIFDIILYDIINTIKSVKKLFRKL